MTCRATPTAHCCWLGKAGECRFLDKTKEGRMCTLRDELGSWTLVHTDPRYVQHVRPFWDRYMPTENCGTWPPPGHECGTCGVTGNG